MSATYGSGGLSTRSFVHESIDFLYQRALFNIFKGDIVRPRGMVTREILNHQLVLLDVRNNVLVSDHRDLNYKFMVAEWLWIMLGLEDVATIAQYNQNIAKFSDDGQIFNGAYGPRIMRQVEYVLRNLKSDADSRQAVITIWSPAPKASKDIPCTISLQFLLREDRLHCTATMRSSDAWLGLPYDMFNFSQITNYLAACLGIEPGSLCMNLGSSHLYESNWEQASNLIGSVTASYRSPTLTARVPFALKRVLQTRKMPQELEGFDRSWLGYMNALCAPSKLVALEILRDLAKEGGDTE